MVMMYLLDGNETTQANENKGDMKNDNRKVSLLDIIVVTADAIVVSGLFVEGAGVALEVGVSAGGGGGDMDVDEVGESQVAGEFVVGALVLPLDLRDLVVQVFGHDVVFYEVLVQLVVLLFALELLVHLVVLLVGELYFGDLAVVAVYVVLF